MKLGSMITSLCKKKGWTLVRLAKESGVPTQTIHNWTVGRTSVNPDQVKMVAKVLEVSVHSLMFGEPDPFEAPTDEILKEIFSGDVRVTLQRIERRRG